MVDDNDPQAKVASELLKSFAGFAISILIALAVTLRRPDLLERIDNFNGTDLHHSPTLLRDDRIRGRLGLMVRCHFGYSARKLNSFA
jgi:hypothetical protein